jgi:signal transduction histidine kinase
LLAATVNAGLTAAALLLAVMNRVSPGDALDDFFAATVAASVSLGAAGVLINLKRPELRLGWLLTGTALACAVPSVTAQYARYALVTHPGSLPAGELTAWLADWTWPIGYALLFVGIPLLFPDGRTLSRRWSYVGLVGVLGTLLLVLSSALQTGANPDLPEVANPYGVHSNVWAVLGPVGTLLIILTLVAAFASLILRHRRATGRERLQLRVFGFAVGVLVLGEVGVPLVWLAVNGSVDDRVLAVSEAASAPWLAVAIGVAVLRHGLYDIEVIINRTVVYAVMTAGVVLAYVAVVGYFTRALHVDGTIPSLVATGLVAVLFHPAREHVQHAIDRLLYGHRNEPYALLADFGRRLETGQGPSLVLGAIAQSVREGLRIPYACVQLRDVDAESGFAESGSQTDIAVKVPLRFGTTVVGELAVAARRPNETFDKADLSLIHTFGRHAGVAAYAVRLALDLQLARERLVGTREEERRRLRRDLHDGFAAQLAGQALTLEAARQLLRTDPDQTELLLMALREHTEQAVGELRQVISDLRPPVLDDRGLLAALRGEVSRYESVQPIVGLVLPDRLPALPAAVEVALLRIASEALTNAVRHSGADSCTLTLHVDPDSAEIRLEICDDGRGVPALHRVGLGLASMRERADELGGSCEIITEVGGGTRVCVRLPTEHGLATA